MKIPKFLTREEQEIIYLVQKGINYPTAVAKQRRVLASPQLKTMRAMERKKLLKSHKEKYLNKTIFTVNKKYALGKIPVKEDKNGSN